VTNSAKPGKIGKMRAAQDLAAPGALLSSVINKAGQLQQVPLQLLAASNKKNYCLMRLELIIDLTTVFEI
jgi:hypothetical protein